MTNTAVIMFSTADWDSKYWTNKQHIAMRLAARGYPVLYIETVGLRSPSFNATDAHRLLRRLRRGLQPLTQLDKNLWRLSPLTFPFAQENGMVARFNSGRLRSSIARWIGRTGAARPLIWTYHPYMLDIAARLAPSRLIYHCVDRVSAIPGINARSFEIAERRLISQADIVFTTSHELQKHSSEIAATKAHYFGNVADVAHFAKARSIDALPPDIARIPRPRLGYVGALSDFKVDFALLDKLATARPDWHLVLIGDERPGQSDAQLAQLCARPNVHRLGWRSYEEVPSYLSGFDVALLPQLINDYTRAMFPMKFFEYLAAGLPVVASPLDSLRDFSAIHRIASTPERFIEAIAASLAATSEPLPVDGAILGQSTWDCQLDRMLAVINSDPS